MGNLEQAAEKKPLIVLTGPTAVGKTALSIQLARRPVGGTREKGRRRDHQRGFDAGVPPHGYRYGKDTPGGDGRCAAPSDRYFRAD